MPNEPEPESAVARKRPYWVAFVLAGVGIVVMNEAADSLRLHALGVLVAVQILVGLACLALALLWGSRRS